MCQCLSGVNNLEGKAGIVGYAYFSFNKYSLIALQSC